MHLSDRYGRKCVKINKTLDANKSRIKINKNCKRCRVDAVASWDAVGCAARYVVRIGTS